ncbi:MAG: hypothetical protein Q7J78_02735 [Clostridiales bacterium]|nr:hypothetical protein [Clostridiales bacterium]
MKGKFLKRVIILVLVMSIVMNYLFVSSLNSVHASVLWTSEKEFRQSLETVGRYRNSAGRIANYGVYRDPAYGEQVIYGAPFALQPEDYRYSPVTGRMEYRYLGYDYGDTRVTNQKFPADPGGGGTLSGWIFVPVPGASDTWSSLDSSQRSHLIGSSLSYPGEQTKKTVAELGGEAFAKVQSAPMWKAGFSVFTLHKAQNGDGLRYATLTGPPMGSASVSCNITADKEVYFIAPGFEYIDIPITITAEVFLAGALMNTSQVASLSAYFEGGNAKIASAKKVEYKTVKRFYKPDFAPGAVTKVNLKGFSRVLSIYGDEIIQYANKEITITFSNDISKASVITNAIAEPSLCNFSGDNVNVAVSVNGRIEGISNLSGVDRWVLYARKNEEISAKQIICLPGNTAKGTFSFSIPAEIIKEKGKKPDGSIDFIQGFIVRARLFFKDGGYTDKEAQCFTRVIKGPDSPAATSTAVPNATPVSTPAMSPPPFPTITPTSAPIATPPSAHIATPTSVPTATPISTPSETSTDIPIATPVFSPTPVPLPSISPTESSGQNPTPTPAPALNKPPIADFGVVRTIMREPENNYLAEIRPFDLSRSPDNDNIIKRIWTICYDSDNDGEFIDEIKEIFSDENEEMPVYKSSKVGKYLLELEIIEDSDLISQPSGNGIEQFGLSGTTSWKPAQEKLVDVINRAPFADFVMLKKRKVDIAFNLADYLTCSHEEIAQWTNSVLIPEFALENIDVRFSIIEPEILTYEIPETPMQEHNVRMEMPEAAEILSATLAGSGNVEVDLIDGKALLNFKNADPSRIEIPSIDVEDFIISSNQSFPEYIAYNSDGYSGNLQKNGLPQSVVTGGSYTDGQEKTAADFRTSNSNSFLNSILYNDGVYSGTLNKNGVSYVISGSYVPGDSKSISDYRTGSSSGGFPENLSYSSAGYSGTLFKSGQPYVISGTYTPAESKTVTVYSVINTVTSKGWNNPWQQDSSTQSNPADPQYNYNSGGFTGILPRTGTEEGLGNPDHGIYHWGTAVNGRSPWTCHRYYRAIYSGTVTKPAQDTRIWRQDYYGIAYKSAVDTRVWRQDYRGTVFCPPVDTRIWGFRQDYNGTVFGPEEKYFEYKVELVYRKRMDIITKNAIWREGAERYFVQIGGSQGEDNDNINNPLDDSGLNMKIPEYRNIQTAAAFQAEILSDAVMPVFIAPESFEESCVEIINQIGNEGFYIGLDESGSVISALNGFTVVLKQRMDALDGIIQKYILKNEEVFYNTYYSDPENDPKFKEEWQYLHDDGYFTSSTGKLNDTGNHIGDSLNIFDKTGKYSVNFRAMDKPDDSSNAQENFVDYFKWSLHSPTVSEIFVHNSPIAYFDASWVPENIFENGIPSISYELSINENSYDPDHTDLKNRGIVNKRWKWKEVYSSEWQSGVPEVLPSDSEVYMLSLEVQDPEGVWSKPFIRILDLSGGNLAPVVSIDPQSMEWNGEGVDIGISVVDPEDDLFSTYYFWSKMKGDIALPPSVVIPTGINDIDAISNGWMKKSETSFYLNVVTSINGNPGGDSILLPSGGEWYLFVMAVDENGAGTLKAAGPYLIDMDMPSVDCSPHDAPNARPGLEILISAEDATSGIDYLKYKWSQSPQFGNGAEFQEQWIMADASNVLVNTPSDVEVSYYLHMEAKDKAGNLVSKVRGPFITYSPEASDIKIEGYWNHWRGQQDIFGNRLTNEPHRFLSLEKVKISIKTKGFAEKVVVRFSPELESMEWNGTNGRYYDYAEDFTGYYVFFPEDSTFLLDPEMEENSLSWEYTLPIAPDTLSWEGDRLHYPYSMTVTISGDGLESVYTIDNIEITGNVYDLIYLDPMN